MRVYKFYFICMISNYNALPLNLVLVYVTVWEVWGLDAPWQFAYVPTMVCIYLHINCIYVHGHSNNNNILMYMH